MVYTNATFIMMPCTILHYTYTIKQTPSQTHARRSTQHNNNNNEYTSDDNIHNNVSTTSILQDTVRDYPFTFPAHDDNRQNTFITRDYRQLSRHLC